MKIDISKPLATVAFGLLIQVSCPNASIPSVSAQDPEGGSVSAGKSIFPGKNLEKAVRKQVFAKRNNQDPITAEDVKSISTIEGRNLEIEDLTGLEHCKVLASLKLPGNQIKELSPVAGLARIQLLDLSDNEVTDISVLRSLECLQYINIENNQVSSIAALSSLENVNSFYAEGNQISDISPLYNLKRLWSVSVGQNRIENLDGISNLSHVDSFGLTDNQISDLGPLLEMIRGRENGGRFLRVYLKGNPLNSSKAKAQLKELKELGLRLDVN